MTIKEAFAQYMQDVLNLGTTEGDDRDIFLTAVPQQAPDRAWWIVGSGGTPVTDNQTGEKLKEYLLNIFHRDKKDSDLDETLQAFEERINSKHCDALEGYDTIKMTAMGFQSDQDLDAEDRSVGMVQVTVQVYQHQ